MRSGRIRGWLWGLFVLVGLALVPWTLWLAQNLPSRHVSRHWDVAWAGLDLALAAVLVAAGIAALRRTSWLPTIAAVAGTLLLVDAWFDVLTARQGELWLSLFEAVALEVPLAAVCLWVAVTEVRGSAGAAVRGMPSFRRRDGDLREDRGGRRRGGAEARR